MLDYAELVAEVMSIDDDAYADFAIEAFYREDPDLGYSPIIDGKLFQGSAPPRGTQLAKQGFKLLVLAAQEYQPSPAAFPGLHVVRCGYDDVPEQPDPALAAKLRGVAQLVEARVRAGDRCLITCMAGLNRSGLITALAVRRLLGVTGRDAANLVRAKRPHALINQDYYNFVAQLAKPSGAR